MKKLLLISALIISIVSCNEEDTPAPSSTTSSTTSTTSTLEEGEIYYRIQTDLYYPPANGASSCDITPGDYTDDNDAVPDNANFGQYYGPCEPGAYDAQFDWDIYNPSGAPDPEFSYSLELPPAGYKRYYTRLLIKYYESTNRCHLLTSSPEYFTYVDEKQ